MTIRERMLAIRLMDRMEQQYQSNMDCVTKDKDGTLKYTDDKGNLLIEARMVEREA